MGVDVFLTTKDREDNCESSLSRSFCNFLSMGHTASKNNEFRQVEELLGIDLSLLRRETEDMELQLFLEELYNELHEAKEKNNTTRMATLEKQIRKTVKKQQNTHEGWTSIGELRELMNCLKAALLANPGYEEELQYNLDWDDYFKSHRTSKRKYQSDLLLEDIEEVLNYLDCAETKGHQWVAFYNG